MNKPSTERRAQILGMVVERMSMRAVTRLTGVSINTVAKLLTDAGTPAPSTTRPTCGHRGTPPDRVRRDAELRLREAAQRAGGEGRAARAMRGTWTAIDADSKLIVSYVLSSSATAWPPSSSWSGNRRHGARSEWIVGLIDANTPPPAKPGPKAKQELRHCASPCLPAVVVATSYTACFSSEKNE